MDKTCFNGLYRVNSQGVFNVPFGSYTKPVINEETTLRAVAKYFTTATIAIENSHFEETAAKAKKGDFVYFDPPYHSPSKTNFTGYQAGGFTEDDHVRLRECFARLAKLKISCLLSNSDTPFIRDLYAKFTIITVPAKRSINANGKGRGCVNELLIKNW